MRKHKSVVAILLAVMMIFTFMPTMAFALPEGSSAAWAKDGSTLTVTIGTKSADLSKYIVRNWDPSTGVMKASLSFEGVDPSTFDSGSVEKYAYENYATDANLTHDYIDLNAAKIMNAQKWTTWSYSNFIYGGYDEDTNEVEPYDLDVYLFPPTYAKNYEENKNAPGKALSDILGSGLSSKFYAEGFTLNSYEDMNNVVVTASVAPTASGAAALNAMPTTGAVPSSSFTVQGLKAELSQLKFGVDDVKKGAIDHFLEEGKVDRDYDGASHKIVNNTVPGYEVAYKLQDNKTKEYVDVKEVEFKDAGTYYGMVVITVTATKAKLEIPFEIYVDTVSAPDFVFAATGTIGRRTPVAEYTVKDTETYDVFNYVIPDTDSKAVKADAELWDQYMRKAFTITETPSKLNPSVIKLELKEADNKAEVDKEFKSLLANYYGTVDVDSPSTATLTIVTDNTKDDDISFEGQTKFVYSGKQTTKKGVLKKKQTITVNATADSGNAITYVATKKADGKITVSTSGKITVKKGLKKGTYTVTVKAKTAAGNGYKAAKEKQTYVIKIAK